MPARSLDRTRRARRGRSPELRDAAVRGGLRPAATGSVCRTWLNRVEEVLALVHGARESRRALATREARRTLMEAAAAGRRIRAPSRARPLLSRTAAVARDWPTAATSGGGLGLPAGPATTELALFCPATPHCGVLSLPGRVGSRPSHPSGLDRARRECCEERPRSGGSMNKLLKAAVAVTPLVLALFANPALGAASKPDAADIRAPLRSPPDAHRQRLSGCRSGSRMRRSSAGAPRPPA